VARQEVSLPQTVNHGAPDTRSGIHLKRDSFLGLIALQRIVKAHQAELHEVVQLNAGWQAAGEMACHASDQWQV